MKSAPSNSQQQQQQQQQQQSNKLPVVVTRQEFQPEDSEDTDVEIS